MSFGLSVCLSLLFAGATAVFIIVGVKARTRAFFIAAALAVVASLAMLAYGLLTLLLIGGIT